MSNKLQKKKVKLPSHIHKFKRVDLNRNKAKPYLVMACQQPGCTSYYGAHLIIGKLAECWICGDPFIINKVSSTHAKPHCDNCIVKKVKPEIADLNKLVENI